LLRCVVGVTVCVHAGVGWPMGSAVGVKGIAVLVGLCLCLGLLTPYCAAVACVLEVALLISTRDPGRFQFWVAALTAAATVGLGPGAYSVDGRLFGRKVIEIPAGRDSR